MYLNLFTDDYGRSTLKRRLTATDSWCELWKFRINEENFEAIYFCRGHGPAKSHPKLGDEARTFIWSNKTHYVQNDLCPLRLRICDSLLNCSVCKTGVFARMIHFHGRHSIPNCMLFQNYVRFLILSQNYADSKQKSRIWTFSVHWTTRNWKQKM